MFVFQAMIWIEDKKSVNFEDTKSKLFCTVFGQPIYFDLNTSLVSKFESRNSFDSLKNKDDESNNKKDISALAATMEEMMKKL